MNLYYNFLLKPASQTQELKIFIVKPGQPISQIATNLEKAKLVKSALAFRLLVAQMGITKNIQAGDFRLSPSMSSRQIAQELTHGAIDLWITLPEGLRIEEQAEKLEEKLRSSANDVYKFDKKEYIKIAKEGYMFPDTYLIPKDATAEGIATKLRETFEQKIDEDLLKKGSKNNLTPDKVVILASLLEKEAKTDQEKSIIAGILINRLRAHVALQVDATVAYAKGYDASKNAWWSPVTINDYRQVKSPYNTYLITGLPSAPISSPGLESIRAAAEPEETEYFYYLHDSKGKIHYAKTVEEHNRNIQDFL